MVEGVVCQYTNDTLVSGVAATDPVSWHKQALQEHGESLASARVIKQVKADAGVAEVDLVAALRKGTHAHIVHAIQRQRELNNAAVDKSSPVSRRQQHKARRVINQRLTRVKVAERVAAFELEAARLERPRTVRHRPDEGQFGVVSDLSAVEMPKLNARVHR